jgi:hypothetical protein
MQNAPRDDRWLQRALAEVRQRLRTLETTPRNTANDLTVNGDLTVAGIGAKLFYAKTSDGPPVNNNTTLVSDPQLVTATLAANTTWAFNSYLKYTSVTAAPGFKMALAVPALATYDWVPVGLVTGSTTDAGSVRLPSTTSLTKSVGTIAATPMVALMQGVVFIGSTPGPVTLQWAQSTATVENTTLLQNSFWKFERVA